eukprot:INCI6922.1.p1 GENE.INCI6922.1~~INCI6922.1.p1  ORF type:complete len:135 (+),score=20.86 INCI6922.1:56-460(+)
MKLCAVFLLVAAALVLQLPFANGAEVEDHTGARKTETDEETLERIRAGHKHKHKGFYSPKREKILKRLAGLGRGNSSSTRGSLAGAGLTKSERLAILHNRRQSKHNHTALAGWAHRFNVSVVHGATDAPSAGNL